MQVKRTKVGIHTESGCLPWREWLAALARVPQRSNNWIISCGNNMLNELANGLIAQKA